MKEEKMLVALKECICLGEAFASSAEAFKTDYPWIAEYSGREDEIPGLKEINEEFIKFMEKLYNTLGVD